MKLPRPPWARVDPPPPPAPDPLTATGPDGSVAVACGPSDNTSHAILVPALPVQLRQLLCVAMPTPPPWQHCAVAAVASRAGAAPSRSRTDRGAHRVVHQPCHRLPEIEQSTVWGSTFVISYVDTATSYSGSLRSTAMRYASTSIAVYVISILVPKHCPHE